VVGGSESLRMRARNYLLDQIRRGILQPGQAIPSVRDLSRGLEVSTSVAFSAIRELREERILERLANGRHRVGQQVERTLQKRHLRVAFCSEGSDHIRLGVYQSIFNHLAQLSVGARIEVDCLLELQDTWSGLEANHYDLMVVADWKPENAETICYGPTIGLDTRGIEVSAVVKTDHFRGGELAGRYLRSQGHRRVVYWDIVPEQVGPFQGLVHRRLGFCKGWIDGGGAMEDVVHLPVMLSEGQDLAPLIHEHQGQADAFFVCWDAGALWMWEALDRLGIRVPDDLALMGYDGSYEALRHTPPLTTVQQPCREIARKVVELVSQWDGGKDAYAYEEFLVAPSLLPGGSA